VSGEDPGGWDAGGGGDAAGGEAAGGPDPSGDEAAWQDLVARYDLPAGPPGGAPWPDRESLTPPARDQGPASHPPGPGDRARVIRPAALPPGPALSPAADGSDAADGPGDDADTAEDHYVPPPPPPLPHLDPIAKGAWAALFGGPAYLLLTSFLGWTVPSWAALLAVTAFVGGFAVVVLRLGDGPSRGAGPDNGAML
jgi:hypothetical protein